MSSTFQPSIEGAQGVGSHLIQQTYPDGAKGIAFSLEEVGARMLKGRLDPRVRSWAIRTLKDAGDPQGTVPRAQALLDGLRKAAIYVNDPVNSEYMQAAHETLCLDDKGFCFKGGDCFPETTLLLRDDYEFVQIKDIKVGDRIWGYNKWSTVEAKVFKGSLKVDAISMNNGSTIQLTEDHHVFVVRCDRHAKRTKSLPCACPTSECRIERILVSEVKEKDRLLQPNRVPFGTKSMDPGVAYIEGLYVSDGSSSHNTRFNIAGQDGCPKEAQKREVQNICKRLGIETKWARKYIDVVDRDWTMRVHQMGTHAPNKHVLSINLNEDTAAETLRGVMADSGANTNSLESRTFTTTSHKLMLQTRVLHRMFGISCGYSYIVDHGGLGENPIWRLSTRQGKRQKLLRVKDITRKVRKTPCYDIQTDDHYVYLPEQDVTVSQCDDLSIALGSATMSIGMMTYVVAQAFNGESLPSHVLLGVEDPQTHNRYRIDPSTKMNVGGLSHFTKEWWIDPLVETKVTLSGAQEQKPADFVGVGAVSATPVTDAVYNSTISQMQALRQSFADSLIRAKTSINQIEQARHILRPNAPYDAEPSNPITSIGDFPTGGTWTASMSTIGQDLISTGDIMLNAIDEAMNGTREIYIDISSAQAYIAAKETDDYRYQIVVNGVTDSIMGVFGPMGVLIGGFTTLLGKLLTPTQIQTAQTAAAAGQPTGLNGTGVGILPALTVVEFVAAAATVAIVSVSAVYALKWLLDFLTTRSEDAAYQTQVEASIACLNGGKIDPTLCIQLAKNAGDTRVDVEKERTKQNQADPFASTMKSIGDVFMWAAIGGVAIAGLMTFGPLVTEGTAELRARREARQAARTPHPEPKPA
jgi:hypothetical protein